jgi:hypothetical protein
MNKARLMLPLIIAMLNFILAATQPGQRAVWAGVGVIFLILGIKRIREAKREPD